MAKKVAFFTLGCKTNQYESEAMASLFRKNGYTTVGFDDEADVYVINTCTVTQLSDKKSRQVIRRAIHKNPEAVVAVAGCYTQVSPEEVMAISGVHVIVGTADKGRIVELVEKAAQDLSTQHLIEDIAERHDFDELPILDYENRTRAFVKIQEGCNNFCTYCIIPYARGRVRSRKPENVLQEVKKLVGEGFAEIVLTGIHIGAYGTELDPKINLADLVIQLAMVPGLKRLRLGSIEPLDITPRLIGAISEINTICRHLHIPVQSGDDEILAKMNRHYNTFEFSRLVTLIRDEIPEIAITTDVIVGFPGETEKHFTNTYNFIKDIAFSKTHVFKYSPRKGTPAASFPEQVETKAKESRSRKLINLDLANQSKFAQCFLGETIDVLAEELVNGETDLWEGLTDNYLRVQFKSNEDIKGQIVPVVCTKVHEHTLLAKMKI